MLNRRLRSTEIDKSQTIVIFCMPSVNHTQRCLTILIISTTLSPMNINSPKPIQWTQTTVIQSTHGSWRSDPYMSAFSRLARQKWEQNTRLLEVNWNLSVGICGLSVIDQNVLKPGVLKDRKSCRHALSFSSTSKAANCLLLNVVVNVW